MNNLHLRHVQTSSSLVIFLGWFLIPEQMLWGLQTLQHFSVQISSWLVATWGKERSVNSVINNRLGSAHTIVFCRCHRAKQSLLPRKSSGAVNMDASFSSSPVFYFFLSQPATLGCSYAQLHSLRSFSWDP